MCVIMEATDSMIQGNIFELLKSTTKIIFYLCLDNFCINFSKKFIFTKKKMNGILVDQFFFFLQDL